MAENMKDRLIILILMVKENCNLQMDHFIKVIFVKELWMVLVIIFGMMVINTLVTNIIILGSYVNGVK